MAGGASERVQSQWAEVLAVAEGDASAIEIIRRQLHGDHVALNDLDEKLAHLASDMGQDEMFVFEAHPK